MGAYYTISRRQAQGGYLKKVIAKVIDPACPAPTVMVYFPAMDVYKNISAASGGDWDAAGKRAHV